jgi:predicted GNAT family N-acyltransferase
MPAYDLVGACLIGRLATSLGFRGQGVGEFLLMNAIQRFVGIAPEIAAPIMVVDAKDQNAVLFYEKFGFVQFPTVKGRLFLPLKTAQAMAVAMR